MKLPKMSIEMMLYLADEKVQRQKYSKDSAEMREAVLTGLLVDIGDAFNVPLETIQTGDKQELTAFVRSLFYFIAREKTHYGMKVLAKIVGRKDHTGCIHHCKNINAFIKDKNPEFFSLWNHYLQNSKLFTPKDFLWIEPSI